MEVLDVLRGFALIGILIANVLMFSGIFFVAMLGEAQQGPFDVYVFYLQEWLVHGKFYSIFSLLFGIGFYIFLSRAEQRGSSPGRLFVRRLTILLAIGLVHALLLWAGDILTLYAMLGFLLLLFYRCSSRTLLIWVIALLASRVVIYALMWWSGMHHPLAPPPEGTAQEGGFNPIVAMVTGFQGNYPEVLTANFIQLYGRWVDLIVSLRLPAVLALFVLGLWIGRQGIAGNLGGHATLLRRTSIWGLGLGLPLNAVWAWLFNDSTPDLPGSPLAMIETLVQAIGVPLLALGYAASIALLLMRGNAWLLWLAPMGRMALTNYLLQSVACMFIFYGFGLGLYGQVGTAKATLVVLPVLLAQVLWSRWWLQHFRFGPVEWLWRRLTYGVPVPFRRSNGV